MPGGARKCPWGAHAIGIENILCESQKAPPSSGLTDRGPHAFKEAKLSVHQGVEKDFPVLLVREIREGFSAPECLLPAPGGRSPNSPHPANVEAKDAFLGRFLPDGKDAQSADKSKSDPSRVKSVDLQNGIRVVPLVAES
jgi:hypothetical protein